MSRVQPAPRVGRKLAQDLRPQSRAVLAITGALLASTLGTVAVPWAVRYGIDEGVGAEDYSALGAAVAVATVAVALAAVCQGIAVSLVAKIGENYLCNLRHRLFGQTLRRPLEFFESEQTGRLVSRLTSDVEAVQELLVNGLTMFVQSALVLVFALASLFVMSWELTLATPSVLPPLVAVTVWFRRRASKAYDRVREAIAAVLAQFQESLAGVREVQAHARVKDRLALFRAVNEAHYDRNVHAAKVSSLYFPMVEYVGVAALAVVLAYGGWRAVTGGASGDGTSGAISVGTITAFLLLVGNVFDPIAHLSQLYNVVQSAQSALRRIYGLLDHGSAEEESTRPVRSGRSASVGIVLRDVTYRYETGEADALSHVDLEIEPGERFALVGRTGAGKSTLAKLAARFHEPTSGSICLGGTDILDLGLAELRSRILLVPQEGHIFSGTVADNVRLGDPGASGGDVAAAAEATGLDRIAAQLPGEYESRLGRGGAALSLGQRQILGLTRILLADPDVAILDEATSALDPATELEVERALSAVSAGRTTVLIAHRLSTASRCDRIGVLSGGRLVETGTHDELLAAGGAYASLWADWSQPGDLLDDVSTDPGIHPGIQ